MHTDAIQLFGSRNTVIRDNWIHDTPSGIMAPDGSDHELVEQNVIDPGEYPFAISLGSDRGSIIRHNTLPDGACAWDLRCGIIAVGGKEGKPPAVGTMIEDNITAEVSLSPGSAPASVARNLIGYGPLIGPETRGGPPPTSAGCSLAPSPTLHWRRSRPVTERRRTGRTAGETMQLGKHLHELWRLRLGVVLALVLGLLAAAWSTNEISLFPPGLKPRSLEMSAASTRLLVDSPKSSVLDLSMSTNDIQGSTNRALLIANVMASAPVREYIARRAKAPVERLQVASPVTPRFPRPLATSKKPKTSDIARSPDEYRLSLTSNPTVPIVDIYAEAPTAEAAQQLANGAVDGMRDYLRDLAAAQRVPAAQQVALEQLGRAKGGVIDEGVSVEVAVLSFLIVFAVSSAAVLFIARVRQGWVAEAAAQRSSRVADPAV